MATRNCALPTCKKLGGLRCGACHCAVYCSKEHQIATWKRHKLWCKLVGTPIPGATCGVVFVGTCEFRELTDDPVLGAAATALATTPRPGWTALPNSICLADHAVAADLKGGYDDSHYQRLAGDLAAAARRYSNTTIVLPRLTALLQTSYCLSSAPCFLLTAGNAAGFTACDLATATAAAYQWAYQREDEVAVPPPSMGMTFSLNRGPTHGPFNVSMHFLSDLLLHSWYVKGIAPDTGSGAAGTSAAKAKAEASPPIMDASYSRWRELAGDLSVVLSPGIDS